MRTLSRDDALARAARELAELPERFARCPPCATAAGHWGALIVGDDVHAVAALDRYPARPGHVVVVARRHRARVSELAEEEWLSLQRLAHRVAVSMEHALSPRRTFVAALGSESPRATSFPHVHVHVIPVGDEGEGARPARVLTWQHGVIAYDDGEAEALAERLRAFIRRA